VPDAPEDVPNVRLSVNLPTSEPVDLRRNAYQPVRSVHSRSARVFAFVQHKFALSSARFHSWSALRTTAAHL